jgi:hypothetical protein
MGMQYQGGLSAALQGQQLGMQGQIAAASWGYRCTTAGGLRRSRA